MQVAPAITFRAVRHSTPIERLVRAQMARLERFCDHVQSCRVAIERPQRGRRTGDPFRVRIDVTVPPRHELVVERTAPDLGPPAALEPVVRDAFRAMRQQLASLVDRQRRDTKPIADSMPRRSAGTWIE